MKIGEFAEVCKTKISVLRHYDKEGVLSPALIDPFTGYRYYTAEQIEVFEKIAVLKKASFSLKEIRRILENTDEIMLWDAVEEKKKELCEALSTLKRIPTLFAETPAERSNTMLHVAIKETAEGLEIRTDYFTFSPEKFAEMKQNLNEFLLRENYQRISGFHTFGKPENTSEHTEIALRVFAVKLQEKEVINPSEPLNLPFEDDDIVGKWEIMGEYAVKEDFYSETFPREPFLAGEQKYLYFLPNGKPYWVFGWTKGQFICRFGDSHFYNRYTTERYDGKEYMFIEYKSFEYRRGGRPSILVLLRLDRKAYTAEEIARKDDVNLPFTDDSCVLGAWRAVDYISDKEQFDPERIQPIGTLFFKRIVFSESGECKSVYGEKTIQGNHIQVWTKGFVLCKWNRTACAYEIRIVDGKEFLIMEWKNGDWIWGGADSTYYVFERE